ncbi:MAG: leucine-rich repeat domain-containing protein [Candidatus Hermodarchaeota archaeon]
MVKVFFSYATKDRDSFQIPKLAQLLEAKPEIEKVYYWEEDATGSILKFMEEKVTEADTCVFFYSAVAAASSAVELERNMAVHLGKHIVPIFTNLEDIPLALRIQAGVNATNKTPEEIVREIYRLITKKFVLTPNRKTEIEQETERQKKVEAERKVPETVFNGVQLVQVEANVLIQLERQLGKAIMKLSSIRSDAFGFITENKHVTGLGLPGIIGLDLKYLPESLGQLTHVQFLYLDHNQLTFLPESLSKLTRLKVLWINSNNLSTFPKSFGNLIQLVELNLAYNRWKALPESFGNLRNLERLYMQGCHLTSLPDSFGNLRSLQTLAFQNNKLTSLPESFGNLISLQKLKLDNSNLTSLPESFGNLKNLKSLVLDKNQLRSLPGSFFKLKNLKHLSLKDTPLSQSQEQRRKVESLIRGCNIEWEE